MFCKRKGAKRFSLLLLEEEEDYVQDWVVTCVWPADVEGNWHSLAQLAGRVRLCTKSLFFEPDDVRVPLVRLPFCGVQRLAAEGGAAGAAFSMTVNQLTKMRANMEEVPYVFERDAMSQWRFTLLYAPLDGFLAAAQELLAASRMPSRLDRASLLEALVRKREDTAVFDTSRLVDFSERLIYEGAALQLTPLVRERGHLVITDARVYFQPLHNVAGDVPVRSHPLVAVAAVARRRSSLRPVGLELFFITAAVARGGGAGGWDEGPPALPSGPLWDAPSAFFAFRTEAERERAAAALSSQSALGLAVPAVGSSSGGGGAASAAGSGKAGSVALAARGLLLEASGAWLRRVTAAWQSARITNFDYLLYLNFAAGRSFNDLAQWPVFPWVLSNYASPTLDLMDDANFRDLSKPVGALNPARLEDFRRRYRDMPDDDMSEGSVPPFMYGTHYSSPGYVMYWLVRAAPSHMLRLQNGRFDAPDRLFSGILESWQSVLKSSTDVKELIPEFFLPNPDFLTNRSALPLGVRQSGRAVADVDLPPWATSPADFLAKNRAALEAPAVSRQLHQWIDLVFGSKQRGAAALAADNLFFHLTYEDAVEVGSGDVLEARARETQINEFGQTPRQLFLLPHPPRSLCPPPPDPAAVFDEPSALSGGAAAGVSSSSAASPSSPRSSFSAVPAASSLRGGASGSGTTADGGDAGLRALTLVLLTTIIAAAAPEFADTSPTADGAAAGGPALPLLTLGAAAAAAAAAGSPASTSGRALPVPGVLLQSAGSIGGDSSCGGSSSVGADSVGALSSLYGSFLKVGRYSRPGPSPAASPTGARAGAVPPVPPAATAADSSTLVDTSSRGGADEAAGRVPSDRHTGAPPLPTSPPLGVTATPTTVAGRATDAAAAAATAAAAAAAAAPVNGTSSVGRGPPPPAASQNGVHSSGGKRDAAAATRETFTDASSSAAAASVGTAAGSEAVGGAVGGGSAGQARSSWSERLAQQLPSARRVSVHLQKEALTAVATPPPGGGWGRPADGVSNGGVVYVAGTGGLLRAVRMDDASVLRTTQLNGDPLCLAALPASAAAQPLARLTVEGGALTTAAAAASAAWNHPVLLIGTLSGQLLAYDPGRGHLLGAATAHDDAVCCAAVGGGDRLATSSWDCSVKLWSLAEGREPWGSGGRYRRPDLELRDFDAGVWALDLEGGGSAGAAAGGAALVAGTEEGAVSCWDLRSSGRAVWQVRIGRDYVGGLRLTPCGRYVVVAAADGGLSLVDRRMVSERSMGPDGGGAPPLVLARAACGAPLRCCATDGRLALAGDEGGSLHLWDVGWLTAHHTPSSPSASLGLDGMYPPWRDSGGSGRGGCSSGGSGGGASINGLALWADPDTDAVHGALARESGELVLLTCGGNAGGV